MKIVKPSFEMLTPINGNEILKSIEVAGRTCYKSEDKITEDSAHKFVAMLIQKGHEAIIEHVSITAKVICDRGVSHEIVRHRIASYAQESTRYCNYGKADEITVISPCFWKKGTIEHELWENLCALAESTYLALIGRAASPQEARSVLPNSLKTEIVMTCNLREWRHFFRLRTSKAAHPQMREIAVPMLAEFKKLIPVIFDDIGVQADE